MSNTASYTTNYFSSPNVSVATNTTTDSNLSQQPQQNVWDIYFTVYTASLAGILLLTVTKGIISSIVGRIRLYLYV